MLTASLITTTIWLAVGFHAAFALVTDLAVRRIPNAWNAAVAAGGLVMHGAASGWRGLAVSAAGAGLLFVLAGLLQLLGAIGGGDVKWFAALGSWTGPSFAFQTFVYTILLAGVMAFGYFLFRGMWRQVMRRWWTAGWLAVVGRSSAPVRHARDRANRSEMPLMIAVLPAVMLAVWQEGGEGIRWWMGL